MRGGTDWRRPRLQDQISDALELQRFTIGQITDPDSAPTAIDENATVRAVRDASLRSGRSRILIMSTDAGPAFVHVRDTLLIDGDEPAFRFSRAAYRVDVGTPVYEVLRHMRERKIQLSVVEDERTLVGIVTLTDVIKRVLPVAQSRS